VDEPVTDKEKANFCDSFSPKKDFGGKSSNSNAVSKSKDVFNSLFGSLTCL
jgi:hypothetical protein